MAIVKMKRLRAIALEEQRDELLTRLLHVGCVEVTEPEDCLTDPEWTALLAKDTGAQGAVKAQVTAVQSALKALDKYAPVKGSLFTKRSDISEADFFDAARQERRRQRQRPSTIVWRRSRSCTPKKTGTDLSETAWCHGRP